MSTPHLDPGGPNSHKGTTVIIAGLCALLVIGAVCGVLNMVNL
jgi:hypothetical protein